MTKMIINTRRTALRCCSLVLVVAACATAEGQTQQRRGAKYDHPAHAARYAKTTAPNTLTAAERRAGWRLLFDGKSTAGWRGYHRDTFPAGRWVVADDAIHHLPGKGGQSTDGGDIITTDQFDNFELSLEWKLAPGGNSGVKYLIDESMPALTGSSNYSGVGFEMQVLDDERHPDAKMGRDGNRTAGSLYDLIPARNKILKPVGEFNHARLIVRGAHVEHWLNDRKVVEYEIDSPEMKRLIAASKYKDVPRFGTIKRGHILLQDHGDAVWYRNIKIRELKPAPTKSARR